MQKKKIDISIIIVQYHAKKVLLDCIQSIFKSSPKVSYEIIVVDNDEKETIKKEFVKLSPKIVYVKSPKNVGFGAGINLGAEHAKGKYLCMLNPDSLIVDKTIDKLYTFISKEKNAGIVSAVLLDSEGNSPEWLAGLTLTPLRAIFTFSIIHTLFPNNPITKKFLIFNKDVKHSKQTASVPLGAAMVKKDIFDEVNGFDEKFFLYYEDFDLCKRIQELGYKNYIYKDAKIIHLGGKGGTGHVKNINKFFLQSRFYYFKKHFGFITALFTEMILRMSKYSLLFAGVFVLSIFLLFYRLADFMPFIGDQGWFYISARDLLLNDQIPLVGITSSHVWLHQGPYWTYMLAGALWLGHFVPVTGAYLTAVIGLFTIWLVYKIGSEVFSSRIGLMASLLYATSPMTLLNERIPYHTSIIGLLTLLLFYALYKWVNGFKYGLPLVILLYTILYNFETATFMLVPIFILILIYGYFKKTAWFSDIFKPTLLALSILSWIVVMIPMILYDIHHGYPQTLKFMEWIVYKIATVFGFPKLHPNAPGETFKTMIPFATTMIKQMIFFDNAAIAWSILLLSFINLLAICKEYLKKKEILQQYSLLCLFFLIPTIGYIVEKTNSGAYLIVFFPTVAFMIALLFDRLMNFKKLFIPSVSLLLIFVFCNVVALFQTNFLTGLNGYGFTFLQRESISKQIIQESKGKAYNLKGKGDYSQYISFTMNYEYLTWWMGHGPSTTEQPLKFIIQETPTKIVLQKKIKD